MCIECYVDKNRITPLLNPLECLRNHTQYICGTCGRCICIEHEPKRGLQRWNFPFRSAEIAKMYLRTADYSTKHPCGIYELKNKNGKLTYKIFASADDLKSYLRKNKNKTVRTLPQRRPLKSAGRIIHESATSSAIMSVKPTAKNMTPVSECLPTDISGISSSTTTYTIAPAAKLKR